MSSTSFSDEPPTPAPSRRYRRSPFLLVEWRDQSLVLVHCDTMRRFRAEPAVLEVLSRLDRWTTPEKLAADGVPVDPEELARLAGMGILEETSETSPDGPHRGRFWSTFDLAVHRQSNTGGFRAELEGEPPPLFKDRGPGPPTALPPPRPLSAAFDQVLGARRSLRAYAERPLRLEELSTLLHHSARIVRAGRNEGLGEYALRPFPGGGARSELEIYVVAQAVDGLARGAYHYDARTHDLELVREADDHQARLVGWAGDATGGVVNRDPAAVLLVTAVFDRIMWKYEGIGLGLIYKDTGCLFQTLYLVATALGLAPCAIGGGEERANSIWLGLDPLVESQVGCFLLGPRLEAAG